MKTVKDILHNVKYDKIVSKLSQYKLFNYCNKFLNKKYNNIYYFYYNPKDYFIYIFIGRTAKDAYFLQFHFNILRQVLEFNKLCILEDVKFEDKMYKSNSLVYVNDLFNSTRVRTQQTTIFKLHKKDDVLFVLKNSEFK